MLKGLRVGESVLKHGGDLLKNKGKRLFETLLEVLVEYLFELVGLYKGKAKPDQIETCSDSKIKLWHKLCQLLLHQFQSKILIRLRRYIKYLF